jgi:GDP-L-fucose synthase
LAATVGGIGANRRNPGRFFYENMAMGLNVIDAARLYGQLEKLVIVGSTCSYPKHTPTPFREEELWNGYPEETNAPYGIAKKALLVMAQGYREQYGLPSIYLIPANLYGPGDNFDPESSHVIPALIRKFVHAKQSASRSVEVWGTGSASREFLYAEDGAEGIVLATLRYEGKDPVNLGTGNEIRINELGDEIRKLVGYEGEIVWNTSEPDGQPRRRLDVQKALEEFGFQALTNLRTGLAKTIEWYQGALSGEVAGSPGESDGGSDSRSCAQLQLRLSGA